MAFLASPAAVAVLTCADHSLSVLIRFHPYQRVQAHSTLSAEAAALDFWVGVLEEAAVIKAEAPAGLAIEAGPTLILLFCLSAEASMPSALALESISAGYGTAARLVLGRPPSRCALPFTCSGLSAADSKACRPSTNLRSAVLQPRSGARISPTWTNSTPVFNA